MSSQSPVPFVLLYEGGLDIFSEHHSFQVLLLHTPHYTTLIELLASYWTIMFAALVITSFSFS